MNPKSSATVKQFVLILLLPICIVSDFNGWTNYKILVSSDTRFVLFLYRFIKIIRTHQHDKKLVSGLKMKNKAN
jgi:hypothetical protein